MRNVAEDEVHLRGLVHVTALLLLAVLLFFHPGCFFVYRQRMSLMVAAFVRFHMLWPYMSVTASITVLFRVVTCDSAFHSYKSSRD